jgi:hypothetical protein
MQEIRPRGWSRVGIVDPPWRGVESPAGRLDSETGLGELILAAVISGGVASVLLGLIFRIVFEPRLAKAADISRSRREWKEQSIAEVLGPVYMQLARSNRAFERWRDRNDFLEGQVVKQANTEIRDLLLAKGHLLPPELVKHAIDLVEHYDRWLEEYARKREGPNADEETGPVFVGPLGFPFPHEADTAFRETFDRLRAELYESRAPAPPAA